jgi:protease IV
MTLTPLRSRRRVLAAIATALAASFVPVAGPGVGPGGGVVPGPAALAAQERPPEVRLRGFVAEVDDGHALWLNPAGLAIRPGWDLFTEVSYDAADFLSDPAFRQALVGARLGGLSLGYRHDRFREDHPLPGAGDPDVSARRRGEAWTVGLGGGTRSVALGAAATFHRVGERVRTYDLGALWRPARWLSVGAAWHDPGATTVRGQPGMDELVGGVSLRPAGDLLTASFQTRAGRPGEVVAGVGGVAGVAGVGGVGGVDVASPGREVTGHDAGLRLLTPWGLELFGRLELDADVAVRDYAVGVQVRMPSSMNQWSARRPRAGGSTVHSVSGLTHGTRDPRALWSPRSVGTATIGGSYVDERPVGLVLFGDPGRGAQPLIRSIRQATRDPGNRALLLRVRPLSGNFIGPVTALHQEIRGEVARYRAETGRPVVAFLDGHVGAAELYLAAVADEVVAPRLAMVTVLGVSFELQRLRRTFERFGISWDALTAGEYKSTFHSHYTEASTPEQAAWIDMLVEGSFEELVAGIAQGRGLAPERVRELMDAPPLTAAAALDAGYIDRIADWEEVREHARELARGAGIRDLREARLRDERWGTPPTIVVVNAHGAITSGESSRNPLGGAATMGSETVSRQLREAADVPGVRAIVLRVTSPGGSAVASDEILAAIRYVREEKGIPVIASMGDMAASGGYWISMHADTILASPLTLTGSIGVVGAIPVLEALMDTLRVNNEVWSRGRFAEGMTLSRHRTPEEMALFERMLDATYDVFLTEVAAGRGLPMDSVRALAGGRVWWGRDAEPVGLVDGMGGLEHAIAVAAERVGIDSPYRVVRLREGSGQLVHRLVQWVGLDGVALLRLPGLTGDVAGAPELRTR